MTNHTTEAKAKMRISVSTSKYLRKLCLPKIRDIRSNLMTLCPYDQFPDLARSRSQQTTLKLMGFEEGNLNYCSLGRHALNQPTKRLTRGDARPMALNFAMSPNLHLRVCRSVLELRWRGSHHLHDTEALLLQVL
jgi:hypothetical protein